MFNIVQMFEGLVNIDSVIAKRLVSCAGKNPGACSVLLQIIATIEEQTEYWLILGLADKLMKTNSEPGSIWGCYKDLNNRDIDKTIDSFKKWIGDCMSSHTHLPSTVDD